MRWEYDDGGRAAAGFRGEARDCVCRAIAIVTGRPYREVYDLINEHCERRYHGRDGDGYTGARLGVRKTDTRALMVAFGLEWTPTMQVGRGCKVHMRADELPSGRIVVKLSHHVAAVVDGVVRDTFDPTRDGKRCVYGYWTWKGEPK